MSLFWGVERSGFGLGGTDDEFPDGEVDVGDAASCAGVCGDAGEEGSAAGRETSVVAASRWDADTRS